MTYEIDKDVPVPMKKRTSSRAYRFPFALMEVGDSFFVPNNPQISPKQALQHMTSSSYSWRKYHNADAQFSCRTVDGGLRCWRVA